MEPAASNRRRRAGAAINRCVRSATLRAAGRFILKIDNYRIRPGRHVHLREYRTDDDGGMVKDEAKSRTDSLRTRLDEL